MPRSIFKVLSSEDSVHRFPLKDLMSELEFVCMNLWAAERIRSEVAAMLAATFTPEELTVEHLERIRFTFWEGRTTHGTLGYSRTFSLVAFLVDPWPSYVDDTTPMSEVIFCSKSIRIGTVGLIEDDNGMGVIKDVQPYWVTREAKRYGDKPFFTEEFQKKTAPTPDRVPYVANAIIGYLAARGSDKQPVIGANTEDFNDESYIVESSIAVDPGNDLFKGNSVSVREAENAVVFTLTYEFTFGSILRTDNIGSAPFGMQRGRMVTYMAHELARALEDVYEFLYNGKLPAHLIPATRPGKEVTIREEGYGIGKRIIGVFKDNAVGGPGRVPKEATVDYSERKTSDTFTIGKDVIRFLNSGVIPHPENN